MTDTHFDDPTIKSVNPLRAQQTPPEEPSKPILLQYDGANLGKSFVLEENVVVIGRKNDPDRVKIWIDDPSVSREHCRLELQGARAFVCDLGSKNGSFVNDTPLGREPAEIRHSDILRVGDIRLRFFAYGHADQLLVDRIYRRAVQDQMLGVFRKDFVQQRLEEEFRLAQAKDLPLSLIFCDLDRFKSINDTHGHDAGDLVLKEVVGTIRPLLRGEMTFGRFGGEEFVLVLPRTDLDAAAAFAEAVRQAVEKAEIRYADRVIPVTVSLGVAARTPGMATAAELVKLADSMVYESKHGGRNRVSRPR
jgi:diguanylate cyclase (GGDEF)-like protein